jgi:hypothetical protein
LAHQLAVQEATDEAKRLSEDYQFRLREKATENFNSSVVEIAQNSAGVIAGSSQQLVTDLISGQDYALERFGLSIMAQAGQSLISNGVQLIGEATKSALTGNLPGAALQGAGAAGLIAAGVGLGGAAGGLGALMNDDAKSGGAARGISTQASGTGAAAGPTQITIVYAPSRDEGAAAVALAGKNAERRGLTGTRTR